MLPLHPPGKLSVLEIMEGFVADDFPCFPKVNDFFWGSNALTMSIWFLEEIGGKQLSPKQLLLFVVAFGEVVEWFLLVKNPTGEKNIKKQKLSSLSLCAGTPLCGWDQFAFFRLFRKGLQINRQAAALTVNVDFRDVWSIGWFFEKYLRVGLIFMFEIYMIHIW